MGAIVTNPHSLHSKWYLSFCKIVSVDPRIVSLVDASLAFYIARQYGPFKGKWSEPLSGGALFVAYQMMAGNGAGTA